MGVSKQKPDTPDVPAEELDYLTIIPLHKEEVEYFIYPYAHFGRVFPFYYRINKGEWIEVNLSGTSAPVFCIDLNKTKELQLKCNSVEFDPESSSIQHFSISSIGSFSLGGTPMSIIYGDDFNAYDYVPESSLVSTFANNSGLESIVNPETFLPYTNVSDSCYVSLFSGCTSLTNSPTLPATTLTYDCYTMMFYGCSNLNHIKMLAKEAKSKSGISIEIEDCLYDWVNGVSPTGTFIKNPDATWEVYGDSGIPNGWTVKMDGEDSGNDFGIDFPLYLEFDYCEESWSNKTCYRDADELGLKLRDVLLNIIDEYGIEINSSSKDVTEQVLDTLGVNIYIDNDKIVSINKTIYSNGSIDVFMLGSDGNTSMIFSNGEIQKDYL